LHNEVATFVAENWRQV